jgi:adenylylsulfate kinase
MIFLQFTGLSGAGKSTIASGVKSEMEKLGFRLEVIDADIYRPILCRDLGYSKEDRKENIRRLGFVGKLLARNGVISILAAINPYDDIRLELDDHTVPVKTVWINCSLDTLIRRDPKGLYRKAFLPEGDSNKLSNLTGVNDPYEIPSHPDLIINTDNEAISLSVKAVVDFLCKEINTAGKVH